MTQRPSTQEERYQAAFDSFERNGAAGDPSWVQQLRQAAIARFRILGFPVVRRGNEEWKYTDVGPIARTPFQSLTGAAPPRVKVQDVKRFTLGGSGWSRLVFVDGIYAPELSSGSSLPAGVSVANLAQALAIKPSLAEQHIARHAHYENQAFTALNTAFIHDGAFVHIPDGTLVKEPIHLLFLSASADTVSHPRVLILMGKESKATIIESYAGLSADRYFTNAVSEVVVGAGAVVNYYRVQQHSEEAFHVGTAQVVQSRDSTFSATSMDVGGGLVRNNLNLLMGGEGSSCTLNGLYIVKGSQHVDNQVIIDHAQPYTTSRQLYKGILDGKSRAAFHGSIIVREGAVKADAQQSDKNLLLSDEAEADTKPALWIYCDDVKCGHGAASGQLDERALFYLRSRGLDQETARRYLIRAFAGEIIDRVQLEPFRVYMDRLFSVALPGLQVGVGA